MVIAQLGNVWQLNITAKQVGLPTHHLKKTKKVMFETPHKKAT